MKKLICILILMVLGISGCSNKQDDTGFIIWMDGYCAAGIDTEYPVAFTLYKQANTSKNDMDITNITFENIGQSIQVSSFTVSEMNFEDDEYTGFVMNLNVEFLETGIFKTDALIITTADNTYRYPIGNWVFDIGEKSGIQADALVDTWSSPVTSSSVGSFPYSFEIKSASSIITAITYAPDITLCNEDGLSSTGKIDITNDFDAPVIFIKPSIEVNDNGQIYNVYSQIGCYCGAINFDDSVIARSKERNSTVETLNLMPSS